MVCMSAGLLWFDNESDATRALRRWQDARGNVRVNATRRTLRTVTDPYALHPDDLVDAYGLALMANREELKLALLSDSLTDDLARAIKPCPGATDEENLHKGRLYPALALAFGHWPWANDRLPWFDAQQRAHQAVVAA